MSTFWETIIRIKNSHTLKFGNYANKKSPRVFVIYIYSVIHLKEGSVIGWENIISAVRLNSVWQSDG